MTQEQWLQLNMKYLLGYSGSNETWWEFLGFFYLQGVCVCVRACVRACVRVYVCGGGGQIVS